MRFFLAALVLGSLVGAVVFSIQAQQPYGNGLHKEKRGAGRFRAVGIVGGVVLLIGVIALGYSPEKQAAKSPGRGEAARHPLAAEVYQVGHEVNQGGGMMRRLFGGGNSMNAFNGLGIVAVFVAVTATALPFRAELEAYWRALRRVCETGPTPELVSLYQAAVKAADDARYGGGRNSNFWSPKSPEQAWLDCFQTPGGSPAKLLPDSPFLPPHLGGGAQAVLGGFLGTI